jgi:hypothetical protein
MHTGCLIKCYGYLGIFVDYENWQDGASLDDKEDGVVGLTKRKTCKCKFGWISDLDQILRKLFGELK